MDIVGFHVVIGELMRLDKIRDHKRIPEEVYTEKVSAYFQNIPEADYRRLHRFCPIGLDGELVVMENWLIDHAHETSKRKTLLRSFAFKWLKRDYDKSC